MRRRIEPIPDKVNQLSGIIVDSALTVHRKLGPGLLERIYEQCLIQELTLRCIKIESQVILPIEYKGLRIDEALRIDILVEDVVVIEIKAVETILPVHEAQLLTYLRLSNKRLGLLINFNSPMIKDGIKRIAN
jgi:GxxExxY protein